MLGRLLNKIFGRKGAAPSPSRRPVSPPRPMVAAAPATAPPPPPPPPPLEPQPAAPVYTGAPQPTAVVDAARGTPDDAAEGVAEPDRARVRLTLADGTTATPGLDPESEERLRYILDNIVPPRSDPPT